MLLHTHLNIKTFSDAIFVIYHITSIIMKLHPLSTIEIYTTFDNLYITVNFHELKESYTITTKRSKKNKKKNL